MDSMKILDLIKTVFFKEEVGQAKALMVSVWQAGCHLHRTWVSEDYGLITLYFFLQTRSKTDSKFNSKNTKVYTQLTI